MSRVLVVVLALSASSCGLLLDGAYLISGKNSYKDVEQRRPTGQQQTAPERRLTFEGPRVRVVCEDVTRGVDRVWSVHKTYEHQGGWYQVHWLPVLLEGIIGGGLAIGFGVKCGDGSGDCNLMYATIPFAVDVAYSLIRLLTIRPPKLVDKSLTQPHTDAHPTPSAKNTTACEPDMEIVATASTSGGPLRLRVDASGWISDQDQAQLMGFVMGYRDAQVRVFGNGKQQVPDLNRCTFFRERQSLDPSRPPVPADCESR
ncbi:MAG: hypothetical protein Q8N23_17215 [Archangium sp.]|nr:hypothetical protein [Archangium sp.]MDP3572975.1 hypothetical protein [Archangium sp.]